VRPAGPNEDPVSSPPISPDSFREQVYRFYSRHGRDLIWRKEITPYRIVVSEIMLQQTRVERVATVFPRFVQRFPDFGPLSEASLGEVLSEWQGLGYNRRALALKKIADTVEADFSGELPRDERILTTMPGIGKATAASITVFAFNIPVAFIETNIRRVFLHCFFPGENEVPDRRIFPLVVESMDRTDPRTWFWALMDYGAHLGRTGGNPNRRSAHYRKQPAFSGSDRQMRGAILRVLVKEGRMEPDRLCDLTGGDAEKFGKLVKTLESEGFIEVQDHFVRITRR
jgi:A/G-specific adenine glycosylase